MALWTHSQSCNMHYAMLLQASTASQWPAAVQQHSGRGCTVCCRQYVACKAASTFSIFKDVHCSGSNSRRLAGLQRQRWERLRTPAGPLDAAPTWTLDQIAGLAFGALMLVLFLSAKQVDVWVARQQRRQLGLCEECGGLYSAETCKLDKCPRRAKQ